MMRESVLTHAVTTAQTVSLNNMKKIIGIALLVICVSYLNYQFGQWVGYERASIEHQQKSTLGTPDQNARIDYYNQQIIITCLRELREVKATAQCATAHEPDATPVWNTDRTTYLCKSPEPEVEAKVLEGNASYYSTTGCLGCSPTLTMANGEPLDDSKITVAYNRAPLNSYVTVTNILTMQSVRAKVTDRGGFERHGKLIDLSVATKNAIGCGSTCPVKVEHE